MKYNLLRVGKALVKKPITVVVAKELISLQPEEWVFHVFGIKEDDENYYALEMTPWDEWAQFKVLDTSIQRYGAPAVVAHALYEMTFFGYSAEMVVMRSEEERESMDLRIQEIRDGTEQWISYEEFLVELGFIDESTAEEREEEIREQRRLWTENKRILEDLLER